MRILCEMPDSQAHTIAIQTIKLQWKPDELEWRRIFKVLPIGINRHLLVYQSRS